MHVCTQGCTHLSSVVEKKASGAISVLSISWVETLLTYQGSLLVTNTLREEGRGEGSRKERDRAPGKDGVRKDRSGEERERTEETCERRESSKYHYNLLHILVFLSMDHQPDNNNVVREYIHL